jgi:hypothetical protein
LEIVKLAEFWESGDGIISDRNLQPFVLGSNDSHATNKRLTRLQFDLPAEPQQPDRTASSKENRKAAASARAKPSRRRAVQRLQHDDPFDSITPPQPPFAQPVGGPN